MTADSLVIAGKIELMGGPGGVPSVLPECRNSAGVGATFQILAESGSSAPYDLGAPVPTTEYVANLLLDGEKPSGRRASNRTIKLPVIIKAPDMNTLAAARETLMQTIDAQTWTLTWRSGASGLALEFDCFRALPTVVQYGFMWNRLAVSLMTIEFRALPYGRSDFTGLVDMPFASPLYGGVSAPPAPVVIDNFASVSGTNWSQSGQHVTGPNSAVFNPPSPACKTYPYVAATYTKTFASKNITGLPALSVWLGQAYDAQNWSYWALFGGKAGLCTTTLNWTLTDASGKTLKFHITKQCKFSNNPYSPAWTRVTAPIPQGDAVFSYTSLTGYSVTITNYTSGSSASYVRLQPYLDAVTANPPSLSLPASTRGTVYHILGTTGTARTPVSCQFQLPTTLPVVQELTGTGLWWPPIGVTSVKAECIGGGGAGGPRTTAGYGGGGGGAEYARENSFTVAAGTPVPYACGTGGVSAPVAQTVTFPSPGTAQWTCPAGVTTVKAEVWGGGGGGAPGSGGGGGGAYACETSLAVTAGKTYSAVVGRGGWGSGTSRNGLSSSFAGDSVTVTANGGISGTSGGTAGGAGGAAGANTVKYKGGNGGTAPSGGGGGGGGGGGTGVAGNNGSNGSGSTGGAGAVAVTGGGAGGVGATVNGWPGNGEWPGGGGGGGFSSSYNGGGGNGGVGAVKLTYTVAAGSPVNGGDTTFGSAAFGATVTAHGGHSVAANTATGGAGGTGSSNGVHYNGGAGFTGTSTGGGGGGSGGSASAGTAATSAAGAPAVADGGKGGDGATPGDTAGSAAAPPGGGGGGAHSDGATEPGGSGGDGQIVVTWTPPLAPFSTLIAHRPGPDAPAELNPCIPVTTTSDTPSGTLYNVPSLISGVNARFDGTYTIVLTAYTWNAATVSSSRKITVTFYQFEYPGGPSYTQAITRTITPSTDVVNGIIIMGEMTLPIKDIDPSNLSTYFGVSIADSDSGDTFLDILLLDSQGQTVIVNVPNNQYTNFFLDEPAIDRDLGRILGSNLDRSQGISVLDYTICSGGPFFLLPGDNIFLAYTTLGAPNLGLRYSSRWFVDRLS